MPIVLDLLVGIDWAFIFGLDLISLSPLPVVIAIIVDFLDCDRYPPRDIVGEVIRCLLAIGLVSLLLFEASFALLVFGQCFAITGNLPKTLRCGLVEGVDDLR